MLQVFTKPLELVTASDIAELPAQAWPEGYEVEFKETLPQSSGGVHPWLSGQGNIGAYARDEILAEVLAFANSQGGTVILGIAETPDNPPRANAVRPLPRVGDLACRFEDAARSCIDPPLPRLQIRAVEIDGQGAGVVIFRTQPSRAAPHRLATTRESYIRHGSSTLKMTMREIQDMALNVARGFAGIDASFAQRRSAFHEWASKDLLVVAYRVTALPLMGLPDPGRLFGKQGVFADARKFQATAGSEAVELQIPVANYQEHPRLRGVSRSGQHIAGAFNWELHQNGLTDLWISVQPWKNPVAGPSAPLEIVLYHSEVLGAVANSLSVVQRYREHVAAPDAEYGIEIEIKEFKDTAGRVAELMELGICPAMYRGLFAHRTMDQYDIKRVSTLLPRVSVGDQNEFENLLSTVDIDIYDALGVRRQTPGPLRVKF